MGVQKRFVKKIPPSGATPTFKLNLPHQVVHQHLLHLVDNDLELAGCPDAEQTWHASITVRRNKDRSEFTLQGWRLFAEAHKIQAGDQVAFELVTRNRLVAQIIKPADGMQLPRTPRATGVKRKAGPASSSVFHCLAGDHMEALDDMLLPTEDEWDIFSEALSSPAGTCDSLDAKSILPQSYKVKPQMVSEWASEDRVADPSLGMELGYHDTRHSLNSTSGYDPSRLRTPATAVPELPYASCMGSPSSPPSPLACAPHPGLLEDSLHDITMGDNEPFMLEGTYGEGAPSGQPDVTPLGDVHSFTPNPPVDIQTPVSGHVDDEPPLVQSLQRQAQAAQFEAEAARQRCERMRRSMQSLQSSLRSHSRKALKAAVGLETCNASLSHTCNHGVPADMASWLGQLKDSLSQLLVMAIDDDHLGADPPPAALSSGSQSTFNRFAVPF